MIFLEDLVLILVLFIEMGFLRKLFKRLRISILLPILSLIAPVLRKKIRLEVMNVEETLNEVFDKKKTIIRFGDGELRILSGTGDTAFQRKSSSLQERLNEVLKDVYKKAGDDKILLCMPGALSDTPREYSLEPAARQFWFEFLVKNFFSLKRLFFRYSGIVFGDASFTRPYMDTKDREYASRVFSRIKNELTGKSVLIIEGRLSRFGVGNDLLSGAKSVRRILGPEVNAFDKYDVLLKRARKEKGVDAVILALGPAAKILSYDLSQAGFWCLDLGHIDIEYEWFMLGSTKRVPVNNKYVNESSKKFVSDGSLNEEYVQQIVFMSEQ